MNKIRIVQSPKTIDYAGTSRVATTFCKYLNMDERFECYLLYNELADNNRLACVKQDLDEKFLIPYIWEHQPGAQAPFHPKSTNLDEVLNSIAPHIVHSHRSSYPESYSFRYRYPKAKHVVTNVFGYADNGNVDRYFYICEYIRRTALMNGAADGPVILNPVEISPTIYPRAYFIEKHHLPEDCIILLRCGRPDNFTDISLKAFELILKRHPNTYYLIVGGCQNWPRVASKLGVDANCRFIDPTSDDAIINGLFAAADIHAHARQDGECQSVSISQAMTYGVPTVSHEGTAYNGHIDQLKDIGFVVGKDEYELYAEFLTRLIEDQELYDYCSEASMERAQDYRPEKVIEQVKDEYLELLGVDP